MLSLERGNPIAKIVKSHKFKEKNGKSKYLGLIDPDKVNDDDRPGYTTDPYQLFNEDEIEEETGSKKAAVTRKTMRKKIQEKRIKDRLGKEFILNDGMLEPVPDIEKERDVLYVSGPSGAGKSTFIATYLKNYCDIFPDNDIYMFSCVDSDPAFEMFESNGPKKYRDKLIRIVLNSEYLEDIRQGEGITEHDLANSAVIFDDIDVMSDKTLKENIINLRSKCLEIGRHFNITTCCTTHQLCNYNKTKILIQESNKVVVFPRSGSTYHISRFLREYCGMKKNEIDKFINLPSRWVMIHKSYPQYILYKDGAYLV